MKNESSYKYNPWPLGKLKPEHQRPEPALLKEHGYDWKDPRDIVDIFERKVSDYFGAKYAVAVDCCSHAIFLSLQYCIERGETEPGETVVLPNRTYISVPMQVLHAGLNVKFENYEWHGKYWLGNTSVVDGAVVWGRNQYVENSLMCLSLQIKKAIPTGRGGVILTDSKEAAEWLKFASYDGRDLTLPYDHPEHIKCLGYHYYMTPEDAARSILLMDDIKDDYGAYMGFGHYPDCEIMLRNAGIIE